jgi:peptidoglycan hydrolase-like protein with peptidoglycan-binding domain
METTEYYHGQPVRVMADFRKYPSWKDSIADHSAMFNRMKRYENLRGLKDYKLACKYVKDDGYATSPTYTQTLINTIEKYRLYEWDIVSPRLLPTLKKGDRNDYVRSWQNYLILQGYDIKSDGIFGDITEKTVKEWQKEVGLKPTGIITPVEWNRIGVY